jgi:hypothetical protein
MLAQMFYRRLHSAVERRRSGNGRQTLSIVPLPASRFAYFELCTRFLLVCILAGIALSFSCGSKPTDVRTVMPADALVYLETKDLGKAVAAITGSEKFKSLASSVPDTGTLNGMEMGVAVTGFQTTEQSLTEENSVLKLQPRFVAAMETHAWNFQVVHFVEEQLGALISDVYGGEALLESSDKFDGKYYVWTAQDGRKAYALVLGSLVFFGNDESAIERCLAVRRGEGDPISRNPIITGGDRLAFGYASPEGIGQLANITGISMAMQASEEGEVKSFIARVLPEILRNSLKEVTWSSFKNEQGVEDRFSVSIDPEAASVFNETLVPGGSGEAGLSPFVPSDALSVTRYDLRDAQIAWRSVLLTAQKQTDQVSGGLILSFSSSLFEPYGIEDPELFMSSVSSTLITARFDTEGENAVVVATVRDVEKLKLSAAKEINFSKPAERQFDADLWRSSDGEIAAALIDSKTILGDAESVLKCLQARQSGETLAKSPMFNLLVESNAVAATIGTDIDSGAKIVDVVNSRKSENADAATQYFTETRFNRHGIERRTVSEFGFIGSIVAQMAPD